MGLLCLSQVKLDRWCLRTKWCLEMAGSAMKEGHGQLVARFTEFHTLGFLRLIRNLTDSERRRYFRVRDRPLRALQSQLLNSVHEDFRGP